jgi:hypothetical protein
MPAVLLPIGGSQVPAINRSQHRRKRKKKVTFRQPQLTTDKRILSEGSDKQGMCAAKTRKTKPVLKSENNSFLSLALSSGKPMHSIVALLTGCSHPQGITCIIVTHPALTTLHRQLHTAST